MSPDSYSPDTQTADWQAQRTAILFNENYYRGIRRKTRRRRLILAGVGAAALIAVLAWAMKPAGQTGGGRGGFARGAGGGGPVPVRAVAATTGTVDVTVDALGTVAALNTATIHSRVDGPLLKVPFREGQLVKGGDLLAQIDPSTFQAALDQAEGQLSKDEAQRAGARVDLERYRGLLAKDSIARQTVDAQRFTVQQLEGAVRADKAAVENVRLQLTFTRITAPFAGRVGLRQVDPGNMVHASDANGIVVLTQTHPIYVVFAVPSEYVPQINRHFSRGDALPVEALDRDGKVVASGKLAAVDNQIDTTTGTIKLKALFDNSDDSLFPEQFVTARLRLDTLSGATLVPSAAVQRGAPGTFVYVVNADNTVSLRKMSPGPSSGDLVSVKDGVRPGEKVVIDGLDKLRDGAQVALIADSARGAASPATPAPPPGQRPHRRHTASSAAPSAQPPAAPVRMTS
ncbi:MAG: MdtA/MuxA family multidrug efflux RND transporter periplasmic adaptor subunit [Gammaproteobacteria bacterium]|nr:MAG: MdtA/MuxA family multidrug efflux RND transporter periplasmic adaptor subunit [Gammaproteobacteria bacterium]TLY96890.1 MAG: MdtA/MuxA family multidrug efflux RND transporter periplasmic adaptor subunit [Gammaproteobacteria bacterium]TLZ62410.1 MAG: MdtA/MuxA family multidrug efflux RND transporter periplasmic adaptor subunit [Gammaproteobacteria bacterium]